MRKVLLTTTLIALLAFSATAQETTFGAKAGINISNYSYNYENSAVEPNTDSRLSVAFGLFADIGISDVFSIRPELLISNKGTNTEATIFGSTLEVTEKLTYLEIPVYGVYKIEASSGNFLINAGPYLGFGIGGEVDLNGETADIEFASEIGDNEDTFYVRGLDFGLNLGIGYELESGIGINFIYSLGLSNIIPDFPSGAGNADDFDTSNSVLRFSVSYKFN